MSIGTARPNEGDALTACIAGALAGDVERLRDTLAAYEGGDGLPELNPRYQDGQRYRRYRREDEERDTAAPYTPLQVQLIAALRADAGRDNAVIAAELNCSASYVTRWRARIGAERW